MPGLEDLYREIILDHYRSPRNRGELEAPPAQRVEGFNPLCGDEIVVTLEVEDGDGVRHQDRRDGLLDQPVLGLADVGGGEGQAGRRGAPADPHLQGDDVHPRVHPAGHGGGSSGECRRSEPIEPEAIDIDALGELAALQGVVKFPVRIKCATLSWNTLAQGLDEVDGRRP